MTVVTDGRDRMGAERVATGPEKFSCSVSAALVKLVNIASNKLDCRKNAAIRHLVDLALNNPDHPVTVQVSGALNQTCLMQAEKGFFATTSAYRIKHALPNNKSAFLRDALPRGASVFKETHPA